MDPARGQILNFNLFKAGIVEKALKIAGHLTSSPANSYKSIRQPPAHLLHRLDLKFASSSPEKISFSRFHSRELLFWTVKILVHCPFKIFHCSQFAKCLLQPCTAPSQMVYSSATPLPIATCSADFQEASKNLVEKCINRHALCRYWARNGQCWKNSDFMQKTCPGACNPACYCKKNWEEPINCVNTVAYCDYWAERGACTIYRDYMMWKCQKACDYRCKPQFSINFTVNKMKSTYETNKYSMQKTPRQAAQKVQKITVMKLSPDMSKVTKE
ncbi:hypothetical protein T09_13333 [Trichinella sp. T9]|nr:hypothetical protein T09_13333 [Trichinella sp. T9]